MDKGRAAQRGLFFLTCLGYPCDFIPETTAYRLRISETQRRSQGKLAYTGLNGIARIAVLSVSDSKL